MGPDRLSLELLCGREYLVLPGPQAYQDEPILI